MLNLAQQDPRWGNEKIGESKSKISSLGCLLTAICDLHSKFYYKGDEYLRPDTMAKKCDFVSTSSDPEPHYLVWKSVEQFDLKFVWRQYTWKPKEFMVSPLTNEKVVTIELLKELSRRSDYGVLIQVETKSGGNHWMAMWQWNILGFPTCFDPNKGIVRWKPWGIGGTYVKATGFAIIKKSH